MQQGTLYEIAPTLVSRAIHASKSKGARLASVLCREDRNKQRHNVHIHANRTVLGRYLARLQAAAEYAFLGQAGLNAVGGLCA